MKLNLGCGTHHPKGFINIDINPEVDPDIIANAKQLCFKSDSANFILSSHVIEHFFIWEVMDVLAEWYRVLKPGAILHIECPDLIKVLHNFIDHPEDGRLHMGGLYGDPDDRNPYQAHHWCYTFENLKRRLEHIGFRDIKEVKILCHDVGRDMALIGVK